MDNYGNQEPNRDEWHDNMSVAMSEQQALIEVLQHQSDISAEEIAALKKAVAENSAITKETRDNSSELLDVLNLMKGGMRVIEFLGKIGKIFAMIGAGYAAYMKLKNGEWPLK